MLTYNTDCQGGGNGRAMKAQGGETELCWIQSSNEAEVKELTTGVVVLRCRDPTLAFNATHRMLLNLCEGGSWIIDPLPPCQPLGASLTQVEQHAVGGVEGESWVPAAEHHNACRQLLYLCFI
ncbi:hypothetical protein Pmani_017247 [Petrolisthes manimaculis]|uniref:Uncharacterized protein n=1 Tax=Petrolisthes manimaculis TaxID=1843537 RepID=A0AAE1PQ34_9EUCA|nr:hypothetical protein Pmani_017247 [Petrolisthes manimaculis]